MREIPSRFSPYLCYSHSASVQKYSAKNFNVAFTRGP